MPIFKSPATEMSLGKKHLKQQKLEERTSYQVLLRITECFPYVPASSATQHKKTLFVFIGKSEFHIPTQLQYFFVLYTNQIQKHKWLWAKRKQ